MEEIVCEQRTITIEKNKCKLTHQIMEQINCCSKLSQRFGHSEIGANNFLMSMYSIESKELGIALESTDKALWKLDEWRVKQAKQVSQKSHIISIQKAKHKTIIPQLELPKDQIQKMSKQPVLFSLNQSDQSKKTRYYLLDFIFHNILQIQNIYKTEKNQEKKNKKIKELFQKIKQDYRDFSSKDKNFINKVLEAYQKYGQGADIYREADLSDQNCGILKPFNKDSKIALVGDWGTNLTDAYDLVEWLVKNQEVQIILHLGDVYYAGFPEEFKKIQNYFQQLRKKYNKNIRYYCIPGNHDDYTYGGPFLDHIDCNNTSEELKQKYSFFCLRDEQNTLQFLGVDTGKNEHSLGNFGDTQFEGTYLQPKEAEWARKRINQFKGQTILLSHHPLFSSYDAILGKYTYYGQYNPQINYQISKQLFNELPLVTGWYWGHQHRCVKYVDWAYGVPCCRLLGNSSFQNNEDSLYQEQYTKIKIVDQMFQPLRSNQNKWYNHTAAIFNLKQDQINVKYIQMSASYQENSQYIRDFSQTLKRPIKQNIETKKYYYIKESSGLSLYYQTCYFKSNYIWLNYVPSKIFFESVDGSSNTVTTGKPYYIIVQGSGYLYLATTYTDNTYYIYVNNQKKNQPEYQWVLRTLNGKNDLNTGDSFNIVSQKNNLELRTLICGSHDAYYYALSTNQSNQIDQRVALFQIYPMI